MSRTVRIVVQVIELYRNMVSPLRLPTCRFTPTCSQYAVSALTGKRVRELPIRLA